MQKARTIKSKCPKIVTIGGGTGHFTLLSGLKKHDVELTAIVTMADDGGSTGLLRDELGVLPPGDLRQCLVALSEADMVVRQLFTHRFANGSLKGHTFGNLFLSALEQVTGSISDAVVRASDILKIKGTVLPVTTEKVSLMMELKNGKVLKGEHAITDYLLISKFGIKKMYLRPEGTANHAALMAIKQADLIVVGPGNLYSSLIPNVLVEGVPQALARARAPKVLVANLMNRFGHTDGFDCSAYVEEVERHAGVRCIDTVLYNTMPIPQGLLKKYVDEGEPLSCGDRGRKGLAYVGADLLSAELYKPKKGDPLRRTLIRHDPDKLARAIVSLLR